MSALNLEPRGFDKFCSPFWRLVSFLDTQRSMGWLWQGGRSEAIKRALHGPGGQPMSDPPWNDWVPGVLSKRQVQLLCKQEYLRGAKPDSMDQSSIDLHLSEEAWELTRGSVKPFGDRYRVRLHEHGLVKPMLPDSNGNFVLEPKTTYLFKAAETLYLHGSPIHGQATARSSIGRLDVLARLIVDGMNSYEEFNPERLANGDMFLEITPITFRVVVRAGIAVSQLRLFCGKPSASEIRDPHVHKVLLNTDLSDGTLSVDLSSVEVGGVNVAAFRADGAKTLSTPLPLWTISPEPDPCEYWRFEEADANNCLKIIPGAFYILRSKEKIAVPKGIAVYCKATDETIGEIRIHYAGFVHPFFGRDSNEKRLSTPLIFEVRGHDIAVNLRDGEKLAHLVFYRMSQDALFDNTDEQPYNAQRLKVSKFFAPWPKRLVLNPDDRSVTPER